MRKLFALAVLAVSLFAPAKSYGWMGVDPNGDPIITLSSQDCYSLLYGGGNTAFMSAKLGQCDTDPNPYALASEWLKDPKILHYVAGQLREAQRVPQIERELVELNAKLVAADEDARNSKYVTRSMLDEKRLAASRGAATAIGTVCILFMLALAFGWLNEYKLRRKAEGRG